MDVPLLPNSDVQSEKKIPTIHRDFGRFTNEFFESVKHVLIGMREEPKQ